MEIQRSATKPTSNAAIAQAAEILTIRDHLIVEVEVYFGWSLPHQAPPGGFVDQTEP